MSPAPEYPKIADALRTSIATGELPPGSPVPSEPVLAARFAVARNTVRRALVELQRDGLITTVPGKGRIVSEPQVPATHARDLLVAYRRVAAELRGAIERGKYAPGGRLPSEATLARRYGVSRETARRALASLRAVGMVSVVHGKGWFVRSDAAGTPGTS